jgi:DNA-binding MarR family transcriptional regulator
MTDVAEIRRFREGLFKPSGVSEPTALVLNLEGRFPSTGVLLELIMPLAQAAKAGTYGPFSLVVCTQDDSVRTIVQALAQAHDLPIFLARSTRELDDAEPLGSLTPTEHETLGVLNSLGGRATISTFADATGLESNAATNRLVSVLNKGFVQRVERPRRQGQLFLDPRAARPLEEPADPTGGDYDVPESVRRSIRALTEMQVREPGAHLANAWQEFLDQNGEYLAAEHERLAELVRKQDKEGISEVGRKFAKKQAQARHDRGRP